MIKWFLLILIPVWGNAAHTPGFLWYNSPQKEHTKKETGIPFRQLSYTDKDAVLKFYTMEALHKVRFTHKMEDERTFLALQDYWLKEASFHGRLNQATLRHYPEYDFSVTHPTSHIGAQITQQLQRKKETRMLRRLANTYGLLFFYRGNHPYDQRQIPILRDFCKTHHFAWTALSVDGVMSNEISNTRLDQGQANALHLQYFPALLLVNPATQTTKPIAFGLVTQDVLVERLMNMEEDQ